MKQPFKLLLQMLLVELQVDLRAINQISLQKKCNLRLNRRSNVPIFDKNSCIICKIPGGKMHKVEFLQTGQNMLKVAEKLEDKSFYLRLNAILNAADAVVNDARYHLKCCVKMQRLIDPKKDLQELDGFKHVACDI